MVPRGGPAYARNINDLCKVRPQGIAEAVRILPASVQLLPQPDIGPSRPEGSRISASRHDRLRPPRTSMQCAVGGSVNPGCGHSATSVGGARGRSSQAERPRRRVRTDKALGDLGSGPLSSDIAHPTFACSANTVPIINGGMPPNWRGQMNLYFIQDGFLKPWAFIP
jgi:hypothetical protein